MTRTYIYGKPQGFIFYEGEVELIDYFKSYYIAERRGRRLDVNRRENGETFYNYIQYGLAEVKRTPQDAFFGMTLVLNEGQYITDVKTLIAFMDLLFEKLVKRGTVLAYDSNGVLRYKVDRFDGVADEVNWIKSNLPNILKRIATRTYDSSFQQGQSGIIATFKSDVSERQVLDVLHTHNWVSICANVSEQDGSNFVEEINLTDIELWRKDINEKLLPIAIGQKNGSLMNLREWRYIANKHRESIHKQNVSSYGNSLKSLDYKLVELCEQLDALILKLVQDEETTKKGGDKTPPPIPMTKNCLNCQRQLPLSEFSSLDAFVCLECEEKKKNEVENKRDKTNKKTHTIKWLLFGVTAVTLLVLGLVGLQKTCSRTEVKTPPVENVVNQAALTEALAAHDFDEVYGQLKEKEDQSNYFKQVKDSIDYYLWSCVENEKKGKIDEFWSEENRDFLELLGFWKESEKAKKEWMMLYEGYPSIQNALKKEQITPDEKTNICNIIDNNITLIQRRKNGLPQEWKNILNNKVVSVQPPPQKRVATQFEVQYIDMYGDAQKRLVNGPPQHNINDVLEKTDVTIIAKDGVFHGGRFGGQQNALITMGEVGSTPQVKCNNTLTIYFKTCKKHYKVK